MRLAIGPTICDRIVGLNAMATQVRLLRTAHNGSADDHVAYAVNGMIALVAALRWS